MKQLELFQVYKSYRVNYGVYDRHGNIVYYKSKPFGSDAYKARRFYNALDRRWYSNNVMLLHTYPALHESISYGY